MFSRVLAVTLLVAAGFPALCQDPQVQPPPTGSVLRPLRRVPLPGEVAGQVANQLVAQGKDDTWARSSIEGGAATSEEEAASRPSRRTAEKERAIPPPTARCSRRMRRTAAPRPTGSGNCVTRMCSTTSLSRKPLWARFQLFDLVRPASARRRGSRRRAGGDPNDRAEEISQYDSHLPRGVSRVSVGPAPASERGVRELFIAYCSSDIEMTRTHQIYGYSRSWGYYGGVVLKIDSYLWRRIRGGYSDEPET